MTSEWIFIIPILIIYFVLLIAIWDMAKDNPNNPQCLVELLNLWRINEHIFYADDTRKWFRMRSYTRRKLFYRNGCKWVTIVTSVKEIDK